MVALIKRYGPRLFPQGWLDLVRQLVLFAAAYYAYRFVRGAVDGRAADAFANARELIDFERSLNLFIEPSVQTWTASTGFLIDFASWMYINSHFFITIVALAWLYLFRNPSFYFVRNMFMVAMFIALVGYVVYPTAPPRFMPEWGFVDSVEQFTGVDPHENNSVNALYNPFAAVPSMHVAFALMIGIPVARLVQRRWIKALWIFYPVLVAWVVVATGNHWWMDAVLGALTALVSAGVADLMARARPAAWAWPGATARARAVA